MKYVSWMYKRLRSRDMMLVMDMFNVHTTIAITYAYRTIEFRFVMSTFDDLILFTIAHLHSYKDIVCKINYI